MPYLAIWGLFGLKYKVVNWPSVYLNFSYLRYFNPVALFVVFYG
jgi:hypothetical protein